MNEIHQIDKTNLGILWQRIRTFVLSLLTTKADRSTTLAGYGITDAYTKSVVDEKIQNIPIPQPQQISLYQDIALAKTWNSYEDISSDGLSNHNGCQHAATNLAVAKVALMLKGRIEEVAENMPANGIDGQDGANGLSAYEIAVNNGFVGTEQEWLLSLKGADGATGERGLQGERGEQGIPGEKGEKGDTGAVGPTGADGQKGQDGRDGIDGKDGHNGADGLSAYELAVKAGFTGTMEEWLKSLIGKDGQKGEKGETGAQGVQGEKGDKGEQGAPGEKGEKGDTGAVGPAGVDGHNGQDGVNGRDGVNGIGLKGEIKTVITTKRDEQTNTNFIDRIENLDDVFESGMYILHSDNMADSILSVETLNDNYIIQYVMVGGYVGINTQKFVHRVWTDKAWTEWGEYDILQHKQDSLHSGHPFTLCVGNAFIQMTEEKLFKLIKLLEE